MEPAGLPCVNRERLRNGGRGGLGRMAAEEAELDGPMLPAEGTEFEALADHAPVLIWRADTTMGCDFFNRPWLEFTGRTMDQERGTGWTAGVHPDDLAQCLAVYSESFAARILGGIPAAPA